MDSNALLAALGAYLIAIVVVDLVLWILLVVANWKIFTKAGEKGWKSIIPIYSDYVRFKITWKPIYFWVLIICSIVTGVLNIIVGANDSLFWLKYVSYVVDLAVAVIHVIALYRLAKSFGHGVGFTVGLVFFPNIFTLIIGFGKDEYTKIEETK